MFGKIWCSKFIGRTSSTQRINSKIMKINDILNANAKCSQKKKKKNTQHFSVIRIKFFKPATEKLLYTFGSYQNGILYTSTWELSFISSSLSTRARKKVIV